MAFLPICPSEMAFLLIPPSEMAYPPKRDSVSAYPGTVTGCSGFVHSAGKVSPWPDTWCCMATLLHMYTFATAFPHMCVFCPATFRLNYT